MSRSLLSIVLALQLTTLAAAQDVSVKSDLTRWRVTAEQFEIDSDENLGLIGIHYDVLEPWRKVPLYVGVGGYAAATGNRGGLFVGGANVGYLKELWSRWNLDVGLFAGGGGGGGNPDTDGLMLRPFVGLEREVGLYSLRFEIAHVNFPDGDIESTHFALGLGLPSELLTASEGTRSRHIPAEAIVRRKTRVTAKALQLDPGSGASRRNGKGFNDEIEAIGIGLDYFYNENFYFPVEAYGALGGGVSGYAMGLVGLGTSWPVFGERVRLEGKAMIGAGGGGDVGTGGGLMWQIAGGVSAQVTRNLALEAQVGVLEATDGDFDADTLSVGLSWAARSPELTLDYPRSRLLREGLSSQDVTVGSTRFTTLAKTYIPPSSARKRNGTEYDTALHLLGVGVEQPLNWGFSATGRAFTAFDGGIGGYAEGLFGLKYELLNYDDQHVFTLAGEAGAAGGGGVDVGSGLIYEYTAGYRYAFSDRTALTVEAGKVEANKGSFEGAAYLLGLSFNLNRATYR